LVLRWVSGDSSANTGTFQPGKVLLLEVTNPSAPPGLLKVMQVYGPVSRTLREITLQDTEPVRDQFDSVRVGETTTYHSDRRWLLPSTRGARVASRFVFDDVVNSQRSLEVRSHRLGTVTLNPQIGAELPIPGTVIGGGGKAGVDADVVLSVDPEVAVVILSGPALAEHMAMALIPDRGDQSAHTTTLLPSPRFREVLGDVFTLPSEWSITPREPRLTAYAGETRRIMLNVEAFTPGSGYFAVAVYDLADPELVAVSEPWRLATDPELQVWVSADMTDDEVARLQNTL
jgi:hypothetical protein